MIKDCFRTPTLAACTILGAFPVSSLARADPSAAAANEQSLWDSLKDPEDGKLDLTASGSGTPTGLVPLILPFNDPAIGTGALFGGVYFHPPKRFESSATQAEPMGTPSMSFAALAASDNETSVLAGGHSHVWREGRNRYTGSLATASVNLKFYGLESGETPADREGLAFNISGVGMLQFTPNQGTRLDMNVGRFDTAFGGDFAYNKFMSSSPL